MTDAIERWMAPLRPWCAYLRATGGVYIEPERSGDASPAWEISVMGRASNADEPRKFREALELLAVVASVDLESFVWIVTELCGARFAYSAPPATSVMPHVALSLHGVPNQVFADDTATLRAFFAPFDLSGESAAFRDAMRELYAIMTPAMRAQLARSGGVQRFPTTLIFTPPDLQGVLRAAYLANVSAVVRDVATQLSAHASSRVAARSLEGDTFLPGVPDILGCYAFELARSNLDMGLADPEGFVRHADALAELAALGVELFPLIMMAEDRELALVSPLHLGQILLGATNSASSRLGEAAPTRVFPGPKTDIEIRDAVHHHRRFLALFSALASTQNTRCARVLNVFRDETDAPRFKKWQWLSYALLSSASTASFTHVSLRDQVLYASDVRAILSVLEAKFPAPLVMDRASLVDFFSGQPNARDRQRLSSCAGGVGAEYAPLFARESDAAQNYQRVRVRDTDVSDGGEEDADARGDHDVGTAMLKRGAVVFVNPFDATDVALYPIELVRDASFMILRNDTRWPWIDILVPGYGYCAVPRACVDSVAIAPVDVANPPISSLERGYTGAITSLKFAFQTFENASEDNVLLPLFQYLGSRLEALSLSFEVASDAAALRRILAACPRLTALTVKPSPLSTLAMLSEAYAAGECSARELSLVNCYPSAPELVVFAEQFRDRRNAMVRRVESLSLGTTFEAPQSEAVFAAFASVLAVNTSLVTIKFDIPVDLRPSIRANLMRTNGKPVSVVKTPLALTSRLAFLSVILQAAPLTRDGDAPPRKRARRTDSLAHSATSAHDLDRDMVRLIFAFAAAPKTRVIVLKPATLNDFSDEDDD